VDVIATLVLTKTFVNLLTTDESVSGYRTADDPDTADMQGRVATYAGGRQRGVISEGVAGGWSFTLRGLTVAQTETLRLWLGQTVYVRDNRGRKQFGVLLSVPRAPWKEQLDLYDVEIALRSVTVVEAI
jgi:hypothetical protein